MEFFIQTKVYPSVKNPETHEQYRAPAFQGRDRPVPNGIEIEHGEIDMNEIPEVQVQIMEEEIKVDTIEDFYKVYINRTQAQCDEESAYAQKSSEWLKSRHYCITASQFGSAIGVSPYQSPDELIQEKLFKSFKGNPSTEYGNQHEPHAREVFCVWLEKKFLQLGYSEIIFEEYNLLKYELCPWVGVSPDGIVKYKDEKGEQKWDLIEYKCPARFKPNQNPYLKHNFGVPPQYMAQIQGIMGFMNLYSPMKFQRTWFIVWIPTESFITEVQFHENYFKELKNRLQTWYFEKFLPVVFMKYQKKLPKTLILN